MREIRFTVLGKALPQGSKNAFKSGSRIVLVEASKGLKPWRSAVALEAKLTMDEVQDQSLIEGAVAVEILFQFQPGKTVRRKEMTTKPDLDKLCRAILDSLTGVCWKDDSQVVELRARKQYGVADLVRIAVMEL